MTECALAQEKQCQSHLEAAQARPPDSHRHPIKVHYNTFVKPPSSAQNGFSDPDDSHTDPFAQAFDCAPVPQQGSAQVGRIRAVSAGKI